MRRSISARWFINTVAVVFIILVVFIVALSAMVQSYAYSSVSNVLTGRMDELLNFLSSTETNYLTDFQNVARNYIENFPDKNSMEIMAVDKYGRIFITSTGFAPDTNQKMEDYTSALTSPDGSGMWQGTLDTGEKVIATTKVVRDADGNLVGSIRYISSLANADQQIHMILVGLILIGVLIMLMIFLTGLYFVRSIVVPIREVTGSARRIAQGHFDVRIEKKREDEIGALCDSINDMASELGTTEQMKNDFISSVSHELRTPLTSIKGWAETIDAGIDPDTTKKGMNVIIRESERLSGLVEELLDFSRLQNDAMKLNINKLDLLTELDSAVFMFTNRATAEGKTLNYEEALTLPPIYGDVDRLKQVLVNVLDNAIKYTESGGVITVLPAVREDNHITITVKDTGCGIPEEHLQNVKKKFFKGNQLVRGSGIGLAMADEIVALHSGTLSIESTENVGTTVTITLPSAALLKEKPELAKTPELKNAVNLL